MVDITIDGRTVNVADEFLDMSDSEQDAAVQEIADSIQSGVFSSDVDKDDSRSHLDPPEGGNILDLAAQGASFGFADEAAGAVGGAYKAATGEGSFSENYTSVRDEMRNRVASFRERNPKTSFAAEMAGGLLTGGVGAARVGAAKAVGGAISKARSAGVGAGQGAAYGLGASEADTIGGLAADTALGAGMGGAMAGGMAGISNVAKSRLKPDVDVNPHQQAAARLERQGITLTSATKSGNDSLRARESDLAGMMAGKPLKDAYEGMTTRFQSKMMEKAGFDQKDIDRGMVTGGALKRAKRKLGDEFTKSLKGKKISFGDNIEFARKLKDLKDEHSELIDSPKRVVKIIDELEKKTSKQMTGNQYQQTRSRLGKLARDNFVRDRTISDMYGDMVSALDKTFDEKFGPITKEVNRKFAHHAQLEEVMRGGGKNIQDGIVPLASLNRIRKKRGGSYDWEQLVGDGVQVFGDTLPNSGTASRSADLAMGASMLMTPALGIPMAGATYGISKHLAKGGGIMPNVAPHLAKISPRSAGYAAPITTGTAQNMPEGVDYSEFEPLVQPELPPSVQPAQQLMNGLIQ